MSLSDVAADAGLCQVLVDFDGTIATLDTTDALLERFAEPAWQTIEDDWKAGQIGSRECMIRQVDLIRASPAEMDAFVAGIAIDPDFAAFVQVCRDRSIAITVVSDGLDRTVDAVLQRHGLELPYKANRLEWLGGDRWRLTFPHARSDCRALSGNCKCQFADLAAGSLRIMIGDGRSDFCVSERVDFVLAKSALLRHAKSRNLPHAAFTDFHEAAQLLLQWVSEAKSPAIAPDAHQAVG